MHSKALRAGVQDDKMLVSMESSDFLSFLPPFIRRHLVPLSLAVVGLLLIVVSLWSLVFSPREQNSDVVFEAGAESNGTDSGQARMTENRQDTAVLGSQDGTLSTITIDVSGAVASPGVITLASSSRVQDAIKAAGGLAPEANNEWIAKNLNLAAKLSDAAKIYIPFVGETPLRSSSFEGQAGTGFVAADGQASGLINVNTASQAQLEGLFGVGPVTAQKIIANRPYSTVDDLLTKKAVGQSVFGKIKGEITTN